MQNYSLNHNLERQVIIKGRAVLDVLEARQAAIKTL